MSEKEVVIQDYTFPHTGIRVINEIDTKAGMADSYIFPIVSTEYITLECTIDGKVGRLSIEKDEQKGQST